MNKNGVFFVIFGSLCFLGCRPAASDSSAQRILFGSTNTHRRFFYVPEGKGICWYINHLRDDSPELRAHLVSPLVIPSSTYRESISKMEPSFWDQMFEDGKDSTEKKESIRKRLLGNLAAANIDVKDVNRYGTTSVSELINALQMVKAPADAKPCPPGTKDKKN